MNPWKDISHLSREDIRSLQNKKLHSFINHYVYPFSPHYRKIFDDNKINPLDIRSVEDLQRIPFTSKLEFIDQDETTNKFRDFILQPDEEKIKKSWPFSKLASLALIKMFKGKEYLDDQMKKEFHPVFMTYTTGTTNKPTPFFYSTHDIDNLYLSGARLLNLFEIKTEEKILNLFPYAPHLAFWQVFFGGLAAHTLALSTGGGKTLGTDGNIKAIIKMQPTLILGVPSYVYHVLRVAKESGCKMDFVKKIVLGASRITEGFKLKLAELLVSMGAKDVSVFGTYGFTEARCAWGESPTALNESSGYHLYPDKEIFEVIDPKTGEVKGEGEDGELVCTSLDARASVVLRYRTGDFVKGGITYSQCPFKKWYIPRLSNDITRLSDVKELQLSKIKGALVNLNHFAAILSDVELIDEWQIEIRKKDNDPYEVDELVVYVCAKDKCNEEQLQEEIKNEILATTEVSPNVVEFIDMPLMVKRLELETANKEKRILDTRPKS